MSDEGYLANFEDFGFDPQQVVYWYVEKGKNVSMLWIAFEGNQQWFKVSSTHEQYNNALDYLRKM